MDTPENQDQERGDSIQFPIGWYYPEGLVSRYSNNMLVQHTKNEFIISFFEIHPPALIGTTEEISSQLENLSHVQAECVARIIVSPDKFSDFIRALQANYEKFLARKESNDED